MKGGHRRRWVSPLSGVALYCLAIFLLLGVAQRSVYGYPVSTGPITLLQVVSDIAPLAAIFCALLILPKGLRGEGAQRLWSFLRKCLLLAAVLLALTLAVAAIGLLWVGADIGPFFRPAALLGLTADLLLEVCLAQLALLVFARRWLAVLVVVLYIALVVLVGQPTGWVQWIGFGTTPDQRITTFDPWPVGSAAAWVARAYWLALLAALAALIFAARGACDRRSRVLGLAAGMVFALVGLTFGFGLHATMAGQRARVPAATADLPPGVKSEGARLTMTRFAAAVDLQDPAKPITIEGTVRLVNQTAAPMNRILLEKAPLLQITAISAPGGKRIWRSPDRRLVSIATDQAIEPGAKVTVRYSARIGRSGTGLPAAWTTSFARGTFLTPALLVPMPRSAACAIPDDDDKPRCGAGENYLLGDRAGGTLTASLPQGWVLADGRTSGNGRFALSVSPSQYGNFLVAAAPFAVTGFDRGQGCPPLKIYLAPGSRQAPGILARVFCEEWRALARDFDIGGTSPFWIAEVPETIALGQSYLSGIALSDHLLDEGADSAVLRHVLAHEIAHRIWGYAIAPEKQPGQQLVLEAIPQYLAFTNHADEAAASGQVERLAGARQDQGGRRTSTDGLWRSTNLADAYLAQPRALLRSDLRGGTSIRSVLADQYRSGAFRGRQSANPERIIADVLARLPAAEGDLLANELGFDKPAISRGNVPRPPRGAGD
jgi:hypothetical protein